MMPTGDDFTASRAQSMGHSLHASEICARMNQLKEDLSAFQGVRLHLDHCNALLYALAARAWCDRVKVAA